MKYFLSLVKALFSRQNLGFILYMAVNALPICLVAARCYSVYHPKLFLPVLFLMFTVYFFSTVTVGSFWARMMLKVQTRVRPDDGGTLGAAFSRAYVAAKGVDPLLSDNIQLYVYEGAEMDAYAFGRSTLCLSSAAAGLPERDLTALLLLKFAQFSHHDSEMLTFMTAGNLWYILLSVLLKGYIYAIGLVLWVILGILGHGFGGMVSFRFLKVWAEVTEKGLLLVMRGFLGLGLHSYRNNVFINDRFVCACGYKNDLVHFLRSYEPEQSVQGTLLGVVDGMKPGKHLRLARLESDAGAPPADAFRIIRRQ